MRKTKWINILGGLLALWIFSHVESLSSQLDTSPGNGTGHEANKNARVAKLVEEGKSGFEWKNVNPGDVIQVSGKTPLYIRNTKGTRDQPIIIRAATGKEAVFRSSIVIEDSSYLVLEGLIVRGSVYSGIIIKKGSHHITVKDCTLAENGMGVWITDKAGGGHQVVGNDIVGNATHGIGIDKVNCSPGQETKISRNRVHKNRQHGIDINGSRYIVEENEVFLNGDKVPGTSGIHVFAKNEREDAGDHNVIRYNIVYQNKEEHGPDGNGIQLDQWCDNNEVSYNVVFLNDGAGINIFDSANDRIFNNTVYGNMLDPDGQHPYKGEFVLATDYERRVNRVDNIVVKNNIVVAKNRRAVSVFVDGQTTNKRLEIGNNVFFHKAAGEIFSWAGLRGSDTTIWKTLAQPDADFFRDPMFEKDDPMRMEDFRLKSGSIAIGRSVRLGQKRDATGRGIPESKFPDLGALEGGPN